MEIVIAIIFFAFYVQSIINNNKIIRAIENITNELYKNRLDDEVFIEDFKKEFLNGKFNA